MPELPEVETVRRGLKSVVTDAKIVSVKLNRRDLRFPFPEDFSERLIGRKILELGRRAKYLLFHLSQDETILSHLGMSGSWRVENDLLRKTFQRPINWLSMIILLWIFRQGMVKFTILFIMMCVALGLCF